MKSLAVLIAIIAVLILAQTTGAADTSSRPAGVAEKDWIAISDRLGFVVVTQKETPIGSGSRQILLAPPERVSAELMPPAKGYFVVKTQTGWQRLVISEPSELAG